MAGLRTLRWAQLFGRCDTFGLDLRLFEAAGRSTDTEDRSWASFALHVGGRDLCAVRDDPGRVVPPAVLVAAGLGSRVGIPKALLSVGGEPLVARLARALACGGCDPVIVVAGARADEVEAATAGISGARVTCIEDPAGPMFASVLAGIAAAGDRALGCGVVIQPVDAPRLSTALVESFLVEVALRRGDGVDGVVAAMGERRGHPLWIAPARVVEVRTAPADHPGGLRAWIRERRWNVLAADLDDPAVLDDADTPADLAALGVGADGSGRGKATTPATSMAKRRK